LKIFPYVTTDFKEYKKLSYSMLKEPSKTAKGYYYNGVIWLKELSPLTLLHEYTHHILNSIGNEDFGTRRFFDLIDAIQDGFYHTIRYKHCRDKETRWYIKEMLKEILEDIIDWYKA